MPIGAEVQAEGGVHFRVWAPPRKTVHVVHARSEAPLQPEGDGYFSALVPGIGDGDLYRLRLDGGEAFPDPASRFQPEGPHGPSQVVDPSRFRWHDAAWRGSPAKGQVIYEMHIGTYTPAGTWRAACGELASLAKLGVTLLEVMPVAEFPGRFGWGYDGVDLFAPAHIYGTPDDFRHFVDTAHALGVGVILDVVYNHIGPDGNYLERFAPDYFTDRYKNEWGKPINFDGDRSAPVRELFVANAGYWIDEYHLDGLRLDATQQIFDASPVNVIAEIGQRVREAARGRDTFVVAENEPQLVKLVRPRAEGGYGLDALWNDDFHHTTHVALTGHAQAYYSDYGGTPQEIISSVKRGFLYQGQWYAWQKQTRGTPTGGLEPWRFVNYIQNHDQIANSATGRRVHHLASPGRWRAITALLLLAPQTPMLFQGQEFAASSPFFYFADHNPELARAVRKGRAQFLAQFPQIQSKEAQHALADPGDADTFERCRLDLGERETHRDAYALHADLLALRRGDPVFGSQDAGLDGAVLGEHAFVVRFFGGDDADRLIVVNLDSELTLARMPEPLLAPPADRKWRLIWSSEDAKYGGEGTPPFESEGSWELPGRSALVFTS